VPRLTDITYDDIAHETEKAWLFIIDGEEQWIPKSIAELDEDSKTVTIPERWAVDKGLV
jgi:hypothetical protein